MILLWSCLIFTLDTIWKEFQKSIYFSFGSGCTHGHDYWLRPMPGYVTSLEADINTYSKVHLLNKLCLFTVEECGEMAFWYFLREVLLTRTLDNPSLQSELYFGQWAPLCRLHEAKEKNRYKKERWSVLLLLFCGHIVVKGQTAIPHLILPLCKAGERLW